MTRIETSCRDEHVGPFTRSVRILACMPPKEQVVVICSACGFSAGQSIVTHEDPTKMPPNWRPGDPIR